MFFVWNKNSNKNYHSVKILILNNLLRVWNPILSIYVIPTDIHDGSVTLKYSGNIVYGKNSFLTFLNGLQEYYSLRALRILSFLCVKSFSPTQRTQRKNTQSSQSKNYVLVYLQSISPAVLPGSLPKCLSSARQAGVGIQFYFIDFHLDSVVFL